LHKAFLKQNPKATEKQSKQKRPKHPAGKRDKERNPTTINHNKAPIWRVTNTFGNMPLIKNRIKHKKEELNLRPTTSEAQRHQQKEKIPLCVRGHRDTNTNSPL